MMETERYVFKCSVCNAVFDEYSSRGHNAADLLDHLVDDHHIELRQATHAANEQLNTALQPRYDGLH